jgi:hypothetical protein
MTQTKDLSANRTGFDGPHGMIFGLSNAEVFSSHDHQPSTRRDPGDDLYESSDDFVDEDDRR